MPDVAVVLLAAGGSRRMGSAKQLLDLGGMPMLRRAAATALSSTAASVFVVCGAESERVERAVSDLPVRLVRNPDWQRGIGTSIRAGIGAAGCEPIDAAIIALADQPLVRTKDYDRLVERHRSTGCPIVASEYAGTLGAPALFDRSLFPDLLGLADEKGCKTILLDAAPQSIARCACPEAVLDVDTPDDYARVRSLA